MHGCTLYACISFLFVGSFFFFIQADRCYSALCMVQGVVVVGFVAHLAQPITDEMCSVCIFMWQRV